jgi:hypothetical protein
MSVFELNINQGNVDEIVRFKATIPDGSVRHFTLRRLTAGPLAAARRVESLYRRANDIEAFTQSDDGNPVPAKILIADLVFFVMGDRGLLGWFLSEVYEGDHDGIDWTAQDGMAVEVMLNLFFVRNFKSESLSSSASRTSSSPSATSSKPVQTRSRRKASTNGPTTKPPRKSRPRRSNSTT